MPLYDTTSNTYFRRAFMNIDVIAEKARETLAGVQFDTMVGTGLSGTLVVPSLARLLNVECWAVVRKESTPHSSVMIEGSIGYRWLFVDDFISSGATRRRVMDQVAWHVPRTTFAGSYLYEWSDGAYNTDLVQQQP